MDKNERLLTINEWLDSIGCDRVYKKDVKETYEKTLPELNTQDAKTREAIAREIFDEIEKPCPHYPVVLPQRPKVDCEFCMDEIKSRFIKKG